MNFSAFLQQAKQQSFWQSSKIFCFSSAQYPHLFFQQLFDWLRSNNMLSIELKKIHTPSLEYQEIIAMLSQSFLGMSIFYWLGDISLMTPKEREKLFVFLQHYQGDNIIAFFTTEAIDLGRAQHVFLTLETELSVVDELVPFFIENTSEQKILGIKKYCKSLQRASLDTLCSVLQQIVFTPAKDFPVLVKSLSSPAQASPELVKLTEYFFMHDEVQFFKQWAVLSTRYPDVFWVSFWSDLVWKAYYIIHFLEQKKFVEAKKMSYRLPHSFLQHGWKKCKKEILVNLYYFLYSIDFSIKQGSTFSSLDLFYLRYFQHTIR